jgi:hypothetical protein
MTCLFHGRTKFALCGSHLDEFSYFLTSVFASIYLRCPVRRNLHEQTAQSAGCVAWFGACRGPDQSACRHRAISRFETRKAAITAASFNSTSRKSIRPYGGDVKASRHHTQPRSPDPAARHRSAEPEHRASILPLRGGPRKKRNKGMPPPATINLTKQKQIQRLLKHVS